MNYSIRTEDTYVDWVRRFVLFHARRHPRDMGAAEIAAFLTHLAVVDKVSASAQNQAKSALLFLYRAVLGIDLPWLTDVASARQGKRLPVVLTVAEVQAVQFLDQVGHQSREFETRARSGLDSHPSTTSRATTTAVRSLACRGTRSWQLKKTSRPAM